MNQKLLAIIHSFVNWWIDHINSKKSYLSYKTLRGYQCNLGDNHSLVYGLKLSKQHWYHTILDRGRHTFDSCILYLSDNHYFEYIQVDMTRMDLQNSLQYRHKLLLFLWFGVYCKWHCLHKDWDNKGRRVFLLMKKKYRLVMYLFKYRWALKTLKRLCFILRGGWILN